MNLGLSGRLTRATIRSPLTPLFLLAALAAGLVALLTIPREEEPQISVPMVDIVVQANGLKAPDAVELVTKPLEAIVKAISGVEHVYSQTQDDRAVVTVRFDVGTNEDDAVLRVNDKIRANLDKIPIGIPEPLDRRARHQRCGGGGADAVAEAAGGCALDRQGPVRSCGQAAHRTDQGRQYRHQLHRRHRRRRKSASSPTRKSCRCSASRCSSSSPRCATPTASSSPAGARRRADAHAGRRADAARRAGYRPAAADHARWPAGLCARRGPGGDRPEHGGEPGVEPDAGRARLGSRCRR